MSDPTFRTSFNARHNIRLKAARSGTGVTLWKTNGTARGTTLLKELPASDTIQYYIWDDILYFNLNNGSSLWRSDGTECGTYSFKTGVPSFGLTGIASTLIFNGYIRKIGMEPYIYNTA